MKRKNKKGILLLELLITAFILGLSFVQIVNYMSNLGKGVAAARSKLQTTFLAQDLLERVTLSMEKGNSPPTTAQYFKNITYHSGAKKLYPFVTDNLAYKFEIFSNATFNSVKLTIFYDSNNDGIVNADELKEVFWTYVHK